MKNILVTGSRGQLGNEIQLTAKQYPENNYFFTDIQELNITNKADIAEFVNTNNINIIVNCAAYTAVDKAEDDIDLCYAINYDAVKNIAEVALEYGLRVIHVSTDYVFDGTNYIPYTENETVCPKSIYGKSKLDGEQVLAEVCKESVIIRTSWLYSSFGNNFVKTMIKLGTERDELRVIADQVGTPTYAADLAAAILQIADSENFTPGIYHYSNEGVCSWYDFTKAIHRLARVNCKVQAIETKDYPTRASRPHYSVLNKTKIKTTFNIQVPHWEESLEKCIEILRT